MNCKKKKKKALAWHYPSSPIVKKWIFPEANFKRKVYKQVVGNGPGITWGLCIMSPYFFLETRRGLLCNGIQEWIISWISALPSNDLLYWPLPHVKCLEPVRNTQVIKILTENMTGFVFFFFLKPQQNRFNHSPVPFSYKSHVLAVFSAKILNKTIT